VTAGPEPSSDVAESAGAGPVLSAASLGEIHFGPDGLIPAIVQEQATNLVLMFAWMDREALRRTVATGRTWFWSRSRQEYWCKGETSGDRQWVRSVRYDCDGDTLLLTVDQDGQGACHTGERSCFYRAIGDGADVGPADDAASASG